MLDDNFSSLISTIQRDRPPKSRRALWALGVGMGALFLGVSWGRWLEQGLPPDSESDEEAKFREDEDVEPPH